MTRSISISLAILLAVAIAAPLIGSSHIELRRASRAFPPTTKFSSTRACPESCWPS